ncbi:hypothetical protein Aglo01_51230 [Actinokineospora globicatena]|uniref:Uncharacterized protein n=1 Tax=Actinokineospora globicatena TaxID=103729 RepID=A0A9W6QPV7_9PSEU|nr:hypothetical protein Aglo01_51230 [Actinokineospora globicatena]GLW87469.1 hypothetical protein Aglo02_51080 [Actinokineospora globicatena]GLW93810.1 hypothetical protein Aglo03_46260 [Actinokineospora globicatena]
MKVVRVSCTCAGPVPNPVASSGNAGRYMSMESGPKVDSPPRMRARRTLLGAGWADIR